MTRHCTTCSSDLEKIGLTTTRHDILRCPVCGTEWVAWYDELKPVVEHIDLDWETYKEMRRAALVE